MLLSGPTRRIGFRQRGLGADSDWASFSEQVVRSYGRGRYDILLRRNLSGGFRGLQGSGAAAIGTAGAAGGSIIGSTVTTAAVNSGLITGGTLAAGALTAGI